MSKEIVINSLEDLPRAAKEFLCYTTERNIFSFKGAMGAGKTTFIKALCEQLDVSDNVTSPTFALLNVYLSPTRGEIYHFDFYRLSSEEQALDIGVEENFYSGNLCFLEWAEKIPNLLPKDCVEVTIKEIDNNKRKITINL